MRYDILSIDFLKEPALAGLPADMAGMGVVSAGQLDSAIRCTFLVDPEYALKMLEARRDLEGTIVLSEAAVRFVRLGWPEEWPHPELPSTWAPVYPDGAEAVQ